MLLIGSGALNLQLHERGLNDMRRAPRDYDIVCTYEQFEELHKEIGFVHVEPMLKGKKIHAVDKERRHWEFELAWDDSTAAELMRLVDGDPLTIRCPISMGGVLRVYGVPSVHVLYALKMSHRYLKDSPHFAKTMKDIRLLRELGAVIQERYIGWFKRREDETYWYKHPNLNQKKDGFFNPNEGVKYVYDHDSIHKAVAHPLPPAYTLYMQEGAEVSCDKQKFFSLPEEERLRGVIEEAYVLALERSQIPHGHKGVPPDWSFTTALRKVCSSITSGWFREYAWEHYEKAMETYDKNYVDRLKRGIETGIVKPYDAASDYRSAQ